MWHHLLTKLASYKVPLVMVSTHGSVVPLAMFGFAIPAKSFLETEILKRRPDLPIPQNEAITKWVFLVQP